MKLREKILLALAVTLISVLVVMLFFTATVIRDGYVNLETDQMQHEASQARAAVDADLSTINSHLMERAAWNDTFTFVTDPTDRSYVSTNNISQTFTTCDINVLLIYDHDHRLLYGQGFNLSSDTFEQFSPLLLDTISTTPGFLNVTAEEGSKTGILMVGDQPMLLASQPVLTSSFLGPSPGVMMMGQYLDPAQVNRLAEQSGVPFTLVQNRSAVGPVSMDSVSISSLNSSQVAAVLPLSDVAGTGSLLIRVQEPRTIVLNGAESARTFIMTTMLISLLFVFLSLGFVDRTVLTRLNRLITGVRAIRMNGENARIEGIAGSDELALLSAAINGMLDELSLAHQSTRESEERYRTLAESAQDLIFLFGTDGRLTYANPTALATLRMTSRESFGQTFTGLFSSEESSSAATVFQMVLETRTPNRFEVDGTIAGSDHCFDVEVIPLINPDGGFGEVMGIARDITERKRVEETIRYMNAYNRSLIEISRDLLIIVDPDGIITDLNATSEQVLGFLRQDMIGTRLAEHFTEPALIRDCCQGVLDNGIRRESEVCIRHREGHIIPLHCTASLFRDYEGTLIGVLVAARDISEENQMEEDRLRLAKLETLGVMSGSLAHQFNNLHTSILGNLTLARSMLYDREALLGRLDEAEDQLTRARMVTNKLLTFSRGGEPLRSFQEVEPLLHEAAENCNGRGSYQIEYRVSDDLPRVFLDRDQIVEALQQLITNAMEAMPRGGTITIVAELCDRTDGEREPQLCIRVIDIGQGIPDENQKKIFELNFTTKDGAAGLGLPLARSVIQKHGGEIEVSSGPGGGTIVTFMIPIGHDRPLDLAPRLPTGRTRVLIMDDEEAITDILRIWLTRRGYDPVITDDGVSAIQAYQEAMIQHRPFDIVFLDLIVPGGMGGEETMRGLLSLDRAVRAVVCSGYSNDPVMASYLDYGFVGLLPKPFQLTAMEELIQSILLGTKGAMPSDPNNSVISDQPE
ncbi:CHASE4 domain-containing protein [Methanosphaerula palustris]|uniref:histidine kinase n=1 Tax=Methanosphaerula palustris (strain ATCC BAA-1556 / DSM 19958 / E1-9c) TaxID=521011 RepID=B8GK53_METPE|nr:CHASE4 domain-containing protein [Methanosphaerula palustris]ACL17124.1 PAS/PAC sensor hybrid histidine kinase [Methanosphaerula palustris E1-9c]